MWGFALVVFTMPQGLGSDWHANPLHIPTKHYATCILAFLYSCLMPHPSGSKLLTNPHVIPHPTPCWGWWGVTMIGALLWVCFCFTQQLLTEVPDSHLLLLQYHQYWTHYSQGSRYLNNLFSYFNRVHLQKYRAPDSLDYHQEVSVSVLAWYCTARGERGCFSLRNRSCKMSAHLVTDTPTYLSTDTLTS